jgi:hypothetical protein
MGKKTKRRSREEKEEIQKNLFSFFTFSPSIQISIPPGKNIDRSDFFKKGDNFMFDLNISAGKRKIQRRLEVHMPPPTRGKIILLIIFDKIDEEEIDFFNDFPDMENFKQKLITIIMEISSKHRKPLVV